MKTASVAGHPAGFAGLSVRDRMGGKPTEIQDPGTTLRFLEVIWSGEVHVVPEAVTDKM